jgi:hypothetical protein
MVQVEVDDFSQRVHLRDPKVADKFCQTILELGVCIVLARKLRSSQCLVLTNNRLKTILAVKGQAGLVR